LKQFPVDRLKLDRSLVEVVESVQDAAIAASIISLARRVQMTVTAEGVETEAQQLFLQQRYCNELQGFLIKLVSWHNGGAGRLKPIQSC
jgi:EAL domain-containing protein (putative c-di-GMP-specific phosphodiesterase class I)